MEGRDNCFYSGRDEDEICGLKGEDTDIRASRVLMLE